MINNEEDYRQRLANDITQFLTKARYIPLGWKISTSELDIDSYLELQDMRAKFKSDVQSALSSYISGHISTSELRSTIEGGGKVES